MKNILLTILLSVLLYSCSDGGGKSSETREYHIGVSQCSSGHWRDKQNSEMQRELLLHDGITMDLVCAEDDTEKQIQQIEHFIEQKVDMIIVSPNYEAPLTKVIAKAYDSGIPVVLFDRFVEGEKYTAFVGGDNVSVGQQLALFAQKCIPEGGTVLELMGNMKTSPARLRHQGFIDEIRNTPHINVIASVDALWNGPMAADIADSIVRQHPEIDVIVAHSDWMASTAQERVAAIMPDNKIHYVGADGFGSPGLGIYAIENGSIDATAIYPTGGDVIMETAIAILKGERYNHKTLLPSYIVSNPKEAKLLITMNNELEHEVSTIVRLRDRILFYMHQLTLERTVLISTIAVLVLIVCLLLTFIRMRIMVKRKDEQITIQRQELEHKEVLIQEKDEVITQKDEVITQKDEEIHDIRERLEIYSEFDREFRDRMCAIVRERLNDTEFNVESLSSAMCLSRAQMYRRCKELTGFTPVEFIRNARMEKAREMFRSGNTSVAQVASAVGIADPSYFTRCYKSHFGIVPREDMMK